MMKKIKESCEASPKAISIATIRNGKPKQFWKMLYGFHK